MIAAVSAESDPHALGYLETQLDNQDETKTSHPMPGMFKLMQRVGRSE